MNYRWGYGWPLLRSYKALTPEESKEVKQQLEQFEVMVKSLYLELELGLRGGRGYIVLLTGSILMQDQELSPSHSMTEATTTANNYILCPLNSHRYLIT